ncbi:MAG TPA: YihY/virulence factor BrkB family protein [Actinomycetales bacterium]|nr:YihY/virulence factor BrkB family protein [Actinomycetales bacterium]
MARVVKAALARLKASHGWRAWERYGRHRGNVLAGGVAYFALFSVFSALAVGITVLGLVAGRDSSLQGDVLDEVDAQLPGLLDIGADGGAVDPADLLADDVLSVAGAVAFVIAVLAGLGWLDAMREGIRAVFGLDTDQRNLVVKKLKDVGVLATLGLAVLASAVLSVVVNAGAGALLEGVGLDGGPIGRVLLRALGVAVVLVVDTAIFMILFRLLSGLSVPWRDLRSGAVFGAVGLGLLKLFGGLLLGGAGGSNPLLAAGAVVVGLLVWMNLVSRLTLVAAAWAATHVAEAGPDHAGTTGRVPPRREVPVGPRDVMAPTFGRRAADRTTLAAGAVLGVGALVSARVAAGGLRAVGDVVRRSTSS